MYSKNIIIILKTILTCFTRLICNVKFKIVFHLLGMKNLVGILFFQFLKKYKGVHSIIAIYELILFVLFEKNVKPNIVAIFDIMYLKQKNCCVIKIFFEIHPNNMIFFPLNIFINIWWIFKLTLRFFVRFNIWKSVLEFLELVCNFF